MLANGKIVMTQPRTQSSFDGERAAVAECARAVALGCSGSGVAVLLSDLSIKLAGNMDADILTRLWNETGCAAGKCRRIYNKKRGNKDYA